MINIFVYVWIICRKRNPVVQLFNNLCVPGSIPGLNKMDEATGDSVQFCDMARGSISISFEDSGEGGGGSESEDSEQLAGGSDCRSRLEISYSESTGGIRFQDSQSQVRLVPPRVLTIVSDPEGSARDLLDPVAGGIQDAVMKAELQEPLVFTFPAPGKFRLRLLLSYSHTLIQYSPTLLLSSYSPKLLLFSWVPS